MHYYIYALLVLFCLVGLNCAEAKNEKLGWPIGEQKYPIGDPRNCVGQNESLLRMEALPGGGFDNLLNNDMGPVINHNYSRCQTSNDGKYLLPDTIYIIPTKKSHMEIFGEIIENWQEYKSMTCSSINAGASFMSVVSGSFSADFEHTKSTQVNDMSSTTRVQVRHNLYKLRLIPDSQLHPTFRSRVLEIAAKIQSNQTGEAEYLTELLVRDYGTHVLTTVDVGAVLAQEDNIKKSFLSDQWSDKASIKASASANFFGKVGLSFGGGHSSSQEFQKKYNDSKTSSRVITHGGPIVHEHFSIKEWSDGLPDALVAIDRDGDPLDYIITPGSLPELPAPLVRQVSSKLQRVIKRYYSINTHQGCTEQGSPNFAYQANIDDGSCKATPTNYTFGGVYQTCKSIRSQAGNLCPEVDQVNPLTGKYSCPSGYEAVLLNKGKKSAQSHHQECHQHCHGWWVFKHCSTDCGEVYYYSDAEYEAYWCSATGKVHDHSGYLFGGLYSKTQGNPVTRTNGCPSKFYPLKLGSDMKVCVSDDYELGYEYSLPFAGFFSCSAGNPLVLHNDLLAAQATLKAGRNSNALPLVMSVKKASPAKWPKKCPSGYSQHLATIDQGCEINFCVKVNSLGFRKLPRLVRPPFNTEYTITPNATRLLYIIGPAMQIYLKNQTTHEWSVGTMSGLERMLKQEKSGAQDEGGMSAGATAGLAIGVALCVGLITAGIIFGVRRRSKLKQPYRRSRRSDTTPFAGSDENAYGSCTADVPPINAQNDEQSPSYAANV